jgi:hypothetical protein
LAVYAAALTGATACGYLWHPKPARNTSSPSASAELFFDELPRAAVASSFDPTREASYDEQKRALQTSEVRLQWDLDHDPSGNPVQRRAIQLGLRGEMLRRYGQEEVLSVEDVTRFAKEQARTLTGDIQDLSVPAERTYRPDYAAAHAIGLETEPPRSAGAVVPPTQNST